MKTIGLQLSISLKRSITWLLIILIAAVLTGCASALFLTALNWVTNYREAHSAIIYFLPFAGLAIGLAYYYWGKEAAKGNNLLLEEYQQPNKIIPFIVAPLVLLGTLITHLFGGSAGREGTAVQMGGTIADRLTNYFELSAGDRQLLIIVGISAGFASVFGTPWAGAVFALEVLTIRKLKVDAIIPSALAAVIADYTCRLWGVPHTHYTITIVPAITVTNIASAAGAGIAFGLTAWLFSSTSHLFSKIFRVITYPPLRPFAAGFVIVAAVWALGTTKYLGLGIPTIVSAFNSELQPYDFIIKLLLTTFTLSAGFKGGEVTPLFFIGATLGNALALFVPLPLAVMAGMGFVAVFSGATNTPLACTIMGMELFGIESSAYLAIACIAAYLVSGNTGIYTSQAKGTKHIIYKRFIRQNLKDL